MIEQEFKFEPNPTNGTYEKATGGTEMMFQQLSNAIAPELLNKFQIICSRVRELEEGKKRILWLSDTWDDPENVHLKDKKNHDKFDKFVFVSNYQFQTYHMAFEIPYGKSIVLQNAIEPIENIDSKPTDRINLIYHTTPHRGLGLLVPAFEFLSQKYQFLTLDVFSNFDIYGWPKRNEPFEPLYDRCRNHPSINYHGTQPNKIVREALAKAHIFTYPSVWPETSCISAIEAMSAGCAIVCPDLAALSETVFDQRFMYRYDEDPTSHLRKFVAETEKAIFTYANEGFTNVSRQANVRFSWETRSQEWQKLLESLL